MALVIAKWEEPKRTTCSSIKQPKKQPILVWTHFLINYLISAEKKKGIGPHLAAYKKMLWLQALYF